jgi:DHA1 family solute carrier family 18 vesicular amine transporter 1/2
LQLVFFQPKYTQIVTEEKSGGTFVLLKDKFVLITVGSVYCSTTAMAVLEPCLPLWLKNNIPDIEDWQLGTVFIPDSFGYLIGTNFLGVFAFKIGRWRCALGAMLLVGFSAMSVCYSCRVV